MLKVLAALNGSPPGSQDNCFICTLFEVIGPVVEAQIVKGRVTGR